MVKYVGWVGVFVSFVCVTAVCAEEGRVHASVGWFNRYVTEGIDHVPDSEFLITDLSIDLQVVDIGVFWAEALRDSYNEVYLSAVRGFSAGDMSLFFGVGRIEFPSGADRGSWEVLGGAEWEIPGIATLFAETWYDIDAVRGGFLEAGLLREFVVPPFGGRLTLEPYALLGVDYGFVSGPRRLKENNAQIGATAYWSLSARATLFAALHHSMALSNLDALDEGDVTWGGAGLAMSF